MEPYRPLLGLAKFYKMVLSVFTLRAQKKNQMIQAKLPRMMLPLAQTRASYSQ